ncbi:MAG: hypothetical protein E7597_07095 [Ruminococcaceae bacterium]|nr:hypothetical protein [Oscillospiraceae bacterium]
MKIKTLLRTVTLLLSLLMLTGVFPMAAYTASAEDSVISLPIVIDGSSLAGITSPQGISDLPTSHEYYHCDNSCNFGEWYISNQWYDINDNVAESFVDGETYYFQIAIHPKEGYKLPSEIENANSHAERREGIKISGVNWERVEGDVFSSANNLYYVMFYITYDAETGVPSSVAEDITLPIEIDGSSLAGITTPAGISNLPVSDEYYYCDGYCCENLFISNVWRDVITDEVATSFVDGRRYYFEIAIHPKTGYKLPDNFDVNDIYENMAVTGVEWEDTIGGISETYNAYWMDFFITYNAGTGVPALLKEITLPIEIDGSSLVGITTPTGISNLPVSDEYYYCDGYCCENLYISNTWRDVITDEVATSFVDGRRYYFEIAIHPKAGHKLPDNFDVDDIYENMAVTGVEWEDTIGGISETYNAYWMDFFITYDEENGIPQELTEIQLPLIIDGSSLVGINEPTGIIDLPLSEGFRYCDNSCNGYFTSNTWYDMNDQEVESFVEGEEYYYQIAIHPNEGYKLPKYFDMNNSIKVEGVEWIGIDANVNDMYNVYWVEFHIVYHETSENPGGLLGDVNFDGSVNSLDAAQILKHDASLIVLEDKALVSGDVNGDGTVNSLDAAQVLKLDAGLISSF